MRDGTYYQFHFTHTHAHTQVQPTSEEGQVQTLLQQLLLQQALSAVVPNSVWQALRGPSASWFDDAGCILAIAAGNCGQCGLFIG
jgi:hypothetical protein